MKSQRLSSLITPWLVIALLLAVPSWARPSAGNATLDDQLRAAVADRDMERVKALLGQGANCVHPPPGRWRNVLIDCASGADSDRALAVLELLIDKCSNINASDRDGRTPLTEAAANLRVAAVQMLIDKGADVNAIDNDGCGALVSAFYNASSMEFRSFIFLGDWAYVNAGKNAWTGMEMPLQGRGKTVVSLLVKDGADINRKFALSRFFDTTYVHSPNAQTPLNKNFTILAWASVVGDAKLVTLLLDKGADPDIKLKDGSTALMWAAILGRSEVVNVLRAHGAEQTLLIAAMIGDKEAVQHFVQAGAEVNEKHALARTVLMEAAWGGDPDTVALVVDRGADLNAKDAYGRTALMEAIWGGKLDVARLLLDRGADPNATNAFGRTALMEAAWADRPDAVTLLVNHGADLDAKDACGTTALTSAVEMGHVGIAKLLIDKGANVNPTEIDGRPLIMTAVLSGRADLVKLLLDHGVRVDTGTSWGRDTLKAAGEAKPAILEMLKQFGWRK